MSNGSGGRRECACLLLRTPHSSLVEDEPHLLPASPNRHELSAFQRGSEALRRDILSDDEVVELTIPLDATRGAMQRRQE